ncbi:MAG: translation initiation factor eIF-1A [Candidatus Lokiarchaeota archaeon]|nr:translation initiation factor eIF-1A [Candidatus Lokiarchaeota archaeon]
MAKKKTQAKRGKGRNQGPVEPEITRVKYPNKKMGEMFARVVDIYGNERMQVFCEDGKHRIGRIRGKIKKRVWVRKGDLVIVNPWEWETQDIEGKLDKCEITWRYMRHEIAWLDRNKKIPEILDINNIPL